MDVDAFRAIGHELIDFIADYRKNIDSYPVMSSVAPGDIKAHFPKVPPEEAEGLASVVADLERAILPGITHWNHPRFFAYFPSNSDLSSVLADIVSTGLGVQGMSWQTSPAATELEEVVVDWLRQLFGLPQDFSGVIQDTASTASLVAMLCARERSTSYSQERAGMQGEARKLAVYASEQAHSSVEKAALLAGFGRDFVRLVPCADDLSIDLVALERALHDDVDAGIVPCCIVGCVGTTATTAVDSILGITALARRFGCWVHVDAAMAGNAMILPECRRHWDGVERADSVVVNPHKWFGVAFDCTAYFVRDPEMLVRVMSTAPSYLKTAVDGAVRNYRDWGIQLGRRFRALKLWFLLRDQGAAAIRARVRRDLENARRLAAQVEAAPGWRVIGPVHFQTVCIRHEPPGLDAGDVDAHNRAWATALNASGFAFVTPAVVRGRQLVRISIGALATESSHVDALWDEIRAIASGLVEAPDA